MKTKSYRGRIVIASFIARVGALLAALALAGTAIEVRAQGTVTVSGADFQRLVYAAHLHTQLATKPELEASLQVLLDMQRRNPAASPAALTGLAQQALQRYRTNAPVFIRTNGFRDEILAAYLDALRQIPAHTNFIPVNLTLLNNFVLGPADYNPNVPPATLICSLVDSGNQRLFASEGAALRRQALVDDCMARARGNGAFATALNSLLLPETGVALADTPVAIIGNTNLPLHDSPTMQTLLTLSQASGNGGLTVSTNQLMNLFTNEMQTIWDTIHTNLAVLAQINQSQPDLLSYLTNQAAIDANVQIWAAVQQNQPAKLACATAAVLVQSELLPVNAESAEMEKAVSCGSELGVGIAELCEGKIGGLESVISGCLEGFNLFGGGQSLQEAMANQISNVQTLVEDLNVNMNYRFDRVDQSLTTIFDTMNQAFTNITITLDAQGRQIAQLNGNVDDIRNSLVTVQASLNRLEQDIFFGFATSERDQYLIGPANAALFYEMQNPGKTMTWNEYAVTPNYESTFFSYAASFAADNNLSPALSLDLDPADLEQQLTLRPLDANLNYIAQFLSGNLGQSPRGSMPLPNPQEWFMGAYAYLQLAAENPMLFREKGPRLPAIISAGQNLTNFCSSLTFNGTNLNWPLYTALENSYITDLISFNAQVSATEGQYATTNSFALGTWRQWDVANPRVTATATKVQGAPQSPSHIFPRRSGSRIAAGAYDSLALRTDDTVVGWGDNTYGQITIPAGLNNVAGIAAGDAFSLALKSDGTVVAWGDNTWSQTNVPAGLTNVTDIVAGADYTLALKANSTVFGWGMNSFGQATGSPQSSPPFTSQGVVTVGGQTLSNVVAVAAGQSHSLAVLRNGTVFGWGHNPYGEATGVPSTQIPPIGSGLVTVAGQTLSNVVKIAAGGHFSLGLRTNGTVVAWGDDSYGQADVPTGLTNVAAITAGDIFSLALKTDGTVVAWGDNSWGQTNIPAGLSGVVAIASRGYHSLALKADGTVVAWGRVSERQCLVPPALAWRGAIAAGGAESLALKANGTIIAWGDNSRSQTSVPAGLTNAAAVAAGGYHNLALNPDGTIVGWGDNTYGEATIPAGLTNVVAVAAGNYFSVALKANGTLVGWGMNPGTIPMGLNNVVAIAAAQQQCLALQADGTVAGWGFIANGYPLAGLSNVVAVAVGAAHCLALKADGTVVGWGDNFWGQINIPAGLTNVVAIAAGNYHSLALKADGTVVGWGDNWFGEATGTINHTPPYTSQGTVTLAGQTLSDVVAIAAGARHSLALKSDGTIVGWGDNSSGQTIVPVPWTNMVAITENLAGQNLGLKADGAVVGWGNLDSLNANYDENTAPAGLANVTAVALGSYHGLGLKTDGTVFGWGDNFYGEVTGSTNRIPPYESQGAVAIAGQTLSNVVAIAAGDNYSLALKTDGTVFGWGHNNYGEASGQEPHYPGPYVWAGAVTIGGQTLSDAVAIAIGYAHSLALKANGTVVAWGYNELGEATGVPSGSQGIITIGGQVLTNVVAISAGYQHNLALKADGTVVGWGYSYWGRITPPPGLSNVVAIAAGDDYSLALKADGTVVGWGDDYFGESDTAGLSNVVAMAAGWGHSLFLTATGTGGSVANGGWSFARAPIPARVHALFRSCNQITIAVLGRASALNTDAGLLAGDKALISAILELGSPYTLARDEVLHGFLYGKESLMDTVAATNFLGTQNVQLQADPTVTPQALTEVAALRYLRFQDRLNLCLTNLQATGRPEIPRLVGHTLRLLNLLNDAYPAVPSPALEIGRQTNTLNLVLYGEPYVHYTLQYRDTLSVPGWTTTTMTNLQDEQTITPPYSGSPQRFYRTSLPTP